MVLLYVDTRAQWKLSPAQLMIGKNMPLFKFNSPCLGLQYKGKEIIHIYIHFSIQVYLDSLEHILL